MSSFDPSPETRRLRSIHWIVGSATVLVVVSILGSLALMLFAARLLDRMEGADEHALVERTVHRTLDRMTRELTSATVWDEAYRSMGPSVNMAWADINYAEYYNRYFGHDLTFAVRNDQVVYASLAGSRVSGAALAALPRDTKAMVDDVARRAALAHKAGKLNLDGKSTKAGLIRSGDEVYLVVAADVIAETAEVAASVPGPPTIVVSARRVSAAFMRGMEEDLGVPGLSVVSQARASAPHVALRDVDGRRIGALTWTADDPGMTLLKTSAPWLALGFALLTAASVVLFLCVTESLKKLALNRLELISAKEEAEAANSAKTQFLANMSHEIRTPLNGVLGMAQIMECDELSAAQRKRLGVIHESGRALLTLLNSILDMARLESGAVRLRSEPFDLSALVESSCAVFSGAAVSKSIELRHAVGPECRGTWIGDPMRLRQVIGNLVANAIKFTEHGSVRVDVRESGEGLRFEVRDTGVGVAQEHQSSLFQKFSQVDGSLTRSHDGSGLGLAISRDLIELMGGRIGLESTLGVGSTFYFEVPLRRAQGERPALHVVGRR